MLNKVQLIGRIAIDLKLNKVKEKKSSLFFTLAVENGYGENKKTQFVPVLAWEKLAENVDKYCKKGSKIYLDGYINIFKDKEQKNQTIINISNVIFLDNKDKTDYEFPVVWD